MHRVFGNIVSTREGRGGEGHNSNNNNSNSKRRRGEEKRRRRYIVALPSVLSIFSYIFFFFHFFFKEIISFSVRVCTYVPLSVRIVVPWRKRTRWIVGAQARGDDDRARIERETWFYGIINGRSVIGNSCYKRRKEKKGLAKWNEKKNDFLRIVSDLIYIYIYIKRICTITVAVNSA